MHSLWQRANHVSALTTSVLMALVSLVSLSTLLIPANVDPASLKVSNLNVVLGRPAHGWRQTTDREYVFAKFDLQADLKPLFNWNTKQVFVYVSADYSTSSYPSNEVVIWDRIIRSPKFARVNIADGKQKYEFKEITNTFRNVSASFKVQYDVHPYVGFLKHGVIGETDVIRLPDVSRRIESRARTAS